MKAIGNSSNLLSLDYRREGAGFAKFNNPAVDIHTHIHGVNAAAIYKEAAELFGIGLVYSMSGINEITSLRGIFKDKIRFIAFPSFHSKDPLFEHGSGYPALVQRFYEKGSRIVKFWAAPRGVDLGESAGDSGLLKLDSPARIEAMRLAESLGMVFMVHVGDPDTWFKKKYNDTGRYGTKLSQYRPFEGLLDRFDVPWIAAHMGGWPEDLAFLDLLLERHENLYLDTSAAKWMVRELSRYSNEEIESFFVKWKTRIIFGSDIVTSDEHLLKGAGSTFKGSQASSAREAFDLYASRYWALRTLLEGFYEGPSPIADPDLAMMDPLRFTEHDSPLLRGRSLPVEVLEHVYFKNAANLLDPLHA